MNIILQPAQEQFINTQIAQGKFANPEYEEWREDVKIKVNESGAELERGEGITLEKVMQQIQAKFDNAREAKL